MFNQYKILDNGLELVKICHHTTPNIWRLVARQTNVGLQQALYVPLQETLMASEDAQTSLIDSRTLHCSSDTSVPVHASFFVNTGTDPSPYCGIVEKLWNPLQNSANRCV